MAAQEVHFNPLAVRQSATAGATRQLKVAQGMVDAVESISDVATMLHQAGEEGKVEELRQAVRQMLEARHEAELYATALQETHDGYEAGPEATDFQVQLAARVQQLAAQQRYNPAHDEAWQAFQDAAGVEPEADDEQIDDDIAIEHAGSSLAPNERCPISGRPLLELREPVVDSRGYVYEQTAILDWLRQHGNSAKCPGAGTTHFVTPNDLQPARRVLKAQARMRKQQRRGVTQTTQRGEDVLDVE